jgi:hypothetical protein
MERFERNRENLKLRKCHYSPSFPEFVARKSCWSILPSFSTPLSCRCSNRNISVQYVERYPITMIYMWLIAPSHFGVNLNGSMTFPEMYVPSRPECFSWWCPWNIGSFIEILLKIQIRREPEIMHSLLFIWLAQIKNCSHPTRRKSGQGNPWIDPIYSEKSRASRNLLHYLPFIVRLTLTFCFLEDFLCPSLCSHFDIKRNSDVCREILGICIQWEETQRNQLTYRWVPKFWEYFKLCERWMESLRSAVFRMKVLNLLVLTTIESLDLWPFRHILQNTASVRYVVSFSVNRTISQNFNCPSQTPFCHCPNRLIDTAMISFPLALRPFWISISEKISIIPKIPIWNPK